MIRIPTTYFPGPFGHFEARIDRLDPRPPRIARESLLAWSRSRR
jgi:hypothetical protein